MPGQEKKKKNAFFGEIKKNSFRKKTAEKRIKTCCEVFAFSYLLHLGIRTKK
jgi:hypothetical protein